VQPALEVEQDVHLLTVKFFKREELGEVKLSILKEGNDNVCLECRDGHGHCATRIIQLQTANCVVFEDLQTGDPLSGWKTF
jgi:hypothetical protein